MNCLPLKMRQKILKNLADPTIFWSNFGLRTFPLSENSTVHLPLNMLVCLALIHNNHYDLAIKLFKRWLSTAAAHLTESGALYAIWRADSGASMGKANQLECLLPAGLLLDLMSLRIQINGDLVLESKDPLLFPVRLVYKGTEITVEEKVTTIKPPGRSQITLPRGKRVIHRF